MTRTYVALLRGINVGGKNKLPMADLVRILDSAGARDVATYIQSGNAVFRAASIEGFAERVEKGIAKKLGLTVPLVLRSAEELARAVDANPFVRAGADVGHLHVGFLAHAPDRAKVAALDPARSPGDSFEVVGREVYLRLPNGVADSKLTNAWFDAKLGTTSTFRNWRTVLKLVEMANGKG
jgi:uncharacterized protein (DUF1697 family)